jgi:hypothetical protein
MAGANGGGHAPIEFPPPVDPQSEFIKRSSAAGPPASPPPTACCSCWATTRS